MNVYIYIYVYLLFRSGFSMTLEILAGHLHGRQRLTLAWP